WKEDAGNDTTCAVAAPTGLAAYNVGGVTVHRLFQLPIEHEGKTAGYWALSKVAQKVMRTNLRSLKLIIIDKVSMLSSLNLAYIHLRLKELFGGSSTWFGSTNLLFVGDILQLPPVNGSPVFSKIANKIIATRMGCMTSVNIWKEAIIYDELTINERQKKDRSFVDILDEVRRGHVSQTTIEHLQQRVINGSTIDKYKELCESGYSPVAECRRRRLRHVPDSGHEFLWRCHHP
ncbi:MAG: AAA family ATPase, partial [Proteobacteria bacterium]|nr:AAA family ATPase [Pseudomonadota bacterium]